MAVRGTTKFKSNKQESKVASEVKGKTVIASGSLWGSKGDVRSDEYLIECKTTEKSFYSLSSIIWNKINSEALKDGLREPVMCIDLEDGKYRFAVVRYHSLYEELDFNKLATQSKSFRIRKDTYPFIISLDSIKPNGITLRLAVMPWEYFLDTLGG